MKKVYIVFLLLLSFSLFAQTVNVKETSEKGIYFKQVGEKIQITSNPSVSGTGQYSFRSGEKAETLEVVGNRGMGTAVPLNAFSSPNDVVVVQDAAGNKYWKTIDGTVVKSEIVSSTGASAVPVKAEKIEKAPEMKEIEVITPVAIEEVKVVEETPIIVEETPVVIEEVIPQAEAPVIVEEVPVVVEETPQVVVEEVPVIVEEEPVVIAPEEEINITPEEVGNVSDLFEKNYEDMNRKEKKLYKKNEKKIMKQLEKELKKERDDE